MYESLYQAGAWKLPVIYVCENNLYGFSVPFSGASAVPDIAVRAASYGFPGAVVDGNDVLTVHEVAQWAIGRARAGEGPSFIECETYRWRGHHMGDQGDTYGYRTQEEIEQWMEKCPILRFNDYLISENLTDAQTLEKIDQDVQRLIDEAVEYAKEAPYPDPSEVFEDVYA